MGIIDKAESKNLSHDQVYNSLQVAVNATIKKIKMRKDLPHVSVESQLELFELLLDFDLGRFLLVYGGLNGYWIDYVLKHPQMGKLTGLNNVNKPFNFLEEFLLNRAPFAVATQARFEIFKTEIQKRVREKVAFASIPCGLMADLLDLNFMNVSDISLTGIDLDQESLDHAMQCAQQLNLQNHCHFIQNDAWALNMDSQFDLITSNGLTIYEPSDARVTELYRVFHKALKAGGCLVTSFLTPPPAPGFKTEWKLDAVDKQDALLQKIIFSDILDQKWQVFRSEETVRSQLQKAGFIEIEIAYDPAHIFPTVMAKKKPLLDSF